MGTPIQLIPAGYLGFLQSKTMGRNPGEAADFVQPTMDLTRMYRAPFRRVTKQSANIAATGLGLFAWSVAVPQGEYWAVEYLHVYVLTAAGQAIRFSPAIFQNGTAECLWSGPVRDIGASQLAIASYTFDDPWIAGPGDAFGANVETITAAPVTAAELKVVFTRLPA